MLAEKVHRGDSGGSGRGRRPHNLPAQITTFVGRERELRDVCRLVSEARLVTLIGVGGVGKTRLALEVADGIRDQFIDGEWLVELAPLTQPSLVPAAIALALGMRDEGATASGLAETTLSERLVVLLRTRRLLLILDNCEHMLDASATVVGRLLAGCPGVSILATSREPLVITGERAWRVPSLELPAAPIVGEVRGHAAAVQRRLRESAAVRLFVDRAASACPTFALTADNSASVATICRRLDGIPLAIELAAARLRGLTVGQVAERLDDRFALLVAGSRTALPRHHTLRALIDWSYGLLPEEEKKLLRRISVFAAGFRIEAACVMAGDEPPAPSSIEGLPPPSGITAPTADEVMDLLGRLVEKSLVVLEEHRGWVRYRLLETIRQYAATRLREAGEERLLRERHLHWCLALAETAELKIRSDDHETWMSWLQMEHDNMRAAIDWSRTDPSDALGPRLVGVLVWFWDVRGYWGEGLAYLEEMLAKAEQRPTCAPPAVRAKLLNGAGLLSYERGDYRSAVPLAQDALALGRELGDTEGICTALHVLGLVAQFQGDCDCASGLLREALDLARSTGDQVYVAQALCDLGVVAHGRLDHARATDLYSRGLALWRRSPDRVKVGQSLVMLGRMAHERGDEGEAARLLDEGLAVARDAGSPRAIAWALLYQGYLARGRGERGKARSAYAESLQQRALIGDRRGIAQCLEALAAVEGDRAAKGPRARAELAARLYGTAQALRHELKAPVLPCDRAEYRRDVAAVRRVLGPTFRDAWHVGVRTSLADAIDVALASAGSRRSMSNDLGRIPDTNESGPELDVLSGREREVVTLIARGLTSKQIAAELSIAKRTVDTHAWNVMAKLGLNSRTQVVAWAVTQGLAPASHS